MAVREGFEPVVEYRYLTPGNVAGISDIISLNAC